MFRSSVLRRVAVTTVTAAQRRAVTASAGVAALATPAAPLTINAPADKVAPFKDFAHTEIVPLRNNIKFNFAGYPPFEGALCAPTQSADTMRHMISKLTLRKNKHAPTYLRGGSGIGKSVLLNWVLYGVLDAHPDCDVFCHTETTNTVTAVLRSKKALAALAACEGSAAAPEPGTPYVIRELRLDSEASRAAQLAAVVAAFPTFNDADGVYLFDPTRGAQNHSSRPLLYFGATVVAGSLQELSPVFTRNAVPIPITDPDADAFLEQAAVVMGGDFNVKLVALQSVAWGPVLRALTYGMYNMAEFGNLVRAAANGDARSIKIVEGRLVGLVVKHVVYTRSSALAGIPLSTVLQKAMAGLNRVTPDAVDQAQALTNETASPEVAKDAGRVFAALRIVKELVRSFSLQKADPLAPLEDRLQALVALERAADDPSVTREAFVEKWGALLPKKHVPPPAFLTQPPKWVDAKTGGLQK